MLLPLLFAIAALPAHAQPAAPPVRALILSGRNNHDWRTTTPFLRKSLEDTGRFDVRVSEEPAGITSATLAGYDVLVSDYNGPRLGVDAEKAIEAFVREGKGIAFVHAASYAFGTLEILGEHQSHTGKTEPVWTNYAEMLGAEWTAAAPKTGHGPRGVFDVKLVNREHAITRGLPETLRASDELYRNFHLVTPFEVLGSTNGDPLIWVKRWGQGRVFHTALGHDVAAMMEPAFLLPFLRGVEWAAVGRVLDTPAPTHASPRVLVVTGGHDYDTSFYRVFDGFDWHHAVTLSAAFKQDVRAKYDVLVLYNMEDEISEGARANLMAFAEAGKGVVVLHHAICSFNDWDWYRDLVGGRYLRKPQGGMPASTYKHDLDLTVKPVAKHPVVAGLPEFHIVDEGYKGKWMSPDVKVLLVAQHAENDGPVAWIGPYAKARVVGLQLGHDRAAHENPLFRTLVKNAILWTAATSR
jgi:type 1 glutamine amidotransferase